MQSAVYCSRRIRVRSKSTSVPLLSHLSRYSLLQDSKARNLSIPWIAIKSVRWGHSDYHLADCLYKVRTRKCLPRASHEVEEETNGPQRDRWGCYVWNRSSWTPCRRVALSKSVKRQTLCAHRRRRQACPNFTAVSDQGSRLITFSAMVRAGLVNLLRYLPMEMLGSL